jgi:hypothetical protein
MKKGLPAGQSFLFGVLMLCMRLGRIMFSQFDAMKQPKL